MLAVSMLREIVSLPPRGCRNTANSSTESVCTRQYIASKIGAMFPFEVTANIADLVAKVSTANKEDG